MAWTRASWWMTQPDIVRPGSVPVTSRTATAASTSVRTRRRGRAAGWTVEALEPGEHLSVGLGQWFIHHIRRDRRAAYATRRSLIQPPPG